MRPIKQMLIVRLDEEAEQQLRDILAHEKTDNSELIRRLIQQRWLALQIGKTVVERLGCPPKHLLKDADPNLSERPNRKRAIAAYLLKQAEHENELLSSHSDRH